MESSAAESTRRSHDILKPRGSPSVALVGYRTSGVAERDQLQRFNGSTETRSLAC